MSNFEAVKQAVGVLAVELNRPETEIIDSLLGVKTPSAEQIELWAEYDRRFDREAEMTVAQYVLR